MWPGHKAKRLVLQVNQWINGVRSNSVGEKHNLSAQKANSSTVGTVGFYIFGCIYIYIYIRLKINPKSVRIRSLS